MTTLKDIAKEAGVSIMTVSNVINGNHSKVSLKTIDKINDLIKKYNYAPNAVARSLSMQSSKIIALCIPGSHTEGLLHSPYNSKIVSAIEKFVNTEGYYLMISSTPNIDQIISNINTWNVDGAIFLGLSNENLNYINSRISTPFICIDTYHNLEKVINIGSDDFKGGYLAAKYFINMGHKNIALASAEEIKSPILSNNTLLYKRYLGFKTALDEVGLELKQDHIFGADVSYEGGIQIGKILAEHSDITAVFSTADIMAIGIIEGARLSGLSVPRNLSVIGYDDLPFSCFVTPKLTTIRQNVDKKGELAASLLFKLIKGEIIKEIDTTLDVELIERQSVLSIQ